MQKQTTNGNMEGPTSAQIVAAMAVPEALLAYHKGTYDLGVFVHVDADCRMLADDMKELAANGGVSMEHIGLKRIPLPEAMTLRGICQCIRADVAANTFLRQQTKTRVESYPEA